MDMSRYWKERCELAERLLILEQTTYPDEISREKGDAREKWVSKVEMIQSLGTVGK